MDKKSDGSIYADNTDDRPSSEEESGFATTVEVFRKTTFGEIPIKQRAYLEVMGLDDNKEVIELGEEEVIIGRSPECGIQLSFKNVSRMHARIFLSNEEYQIEDLNSTNGIYVNGIKVVKCLLRDHDQIEIGKVKILFNEEKMLQRT